MYQQFKLKLACDHVLEEVAVLEYEGKPYNPDYVGRRVQCSEPGCRKWCKVVSQDPPHEEET